MKRLLAIAAGLALASCATLGGDKKKEPAVDKVALINIIPFDVAACGPRALELTPLTTEVLFGAILSVDPAFQECFLDARSLDGLELKDNAIRATVGTAVTFEVLGTGITASGKECLAAAARKLPFKPLDAAAKPVTADVPVGPASKPVAFGVNVGSDAVGTIRLAQPSFCPCYAELGTRPAPVLEAKVTLAKTKPPEFVLESPDAPALGTCVLEKLKGLTLPVGDVSLPYKFLLKNAYAAEPTPGALPALQFQQLEGMRAQKTADVLLAAGRHMTAATAYDAVATRYKANPRANIALISELRSKCAAVVASNDGQLGALKALLGVVDSATKLVQGEKVKDPAWAATEEALAKQQGTFSAELTRVEAQKKADEGACPKNR